MLVKTLSTKLTLPQSREGRRPTNTPPSFIHRYMRLDNKQPRVLLGMASNCDIQFADEHDENTRFVFDTFDNGHKYVSSGGRAST